MFLLAGSMSPVNARQIAAAAAYVEVPLDAGRLTQGDSVYFTMISDMVAELLRDGRNVLAHTAGSPEVLAREAQPLLAPACGRLLHRVLESCPIRRAGIAGGDTSSHAVQALAPWGLSCWAVWAPASPSAACAPTIRRSTGSKSC